MKVPFVDLPARFAGQQSRLHEVLDRVLSHGQMILGREVEAFESQLSGYLAQENVVAIGNATDGLILSMQALGLKPGDEVITTPMSYLASTSSIVLAGLTPVFADVGEDLNLSAQSAESLITSKTKAILVVHLAGNPADMNAIMALANKHQLKVIEDCAQSFGASINGQQVGTFGDFGVYSFHPLKTLCTLGDAGAIVCRDSAHKEWLLKARNHGHLGRDDCAFWSMNSRMDSLHAGFLSVMLSAYDDFLKERRAQVAKYQVRLDGIIRFPTSLPCAVQSYGMFVSLVQKRDALQAYLLDKGIETKIHYPKMIPELLSARHINITLDLAAAKRFGQQILSLPVGNHINNEQIDYVVDSIAEFYQ